MKNQRAFIKFSLAAVAWLLAFAPVASPACAACYGEPDSPMGRGLAAAVIALATVVTLVLVGVTAFFVRIGRHQSAEDQSPENDNQI